MEKRNKTKSALKKTTNIFRRNTKSRLAIQKFLNDLQEQESEYLNENKQITQCVFLGALCLKPVPDIFQVTLQPVSFTSHSKTSILYNNSVKSVNNNVAERDSVLQSEETSKVKVKKNPRKNSKNSTIETKVFIGNICEPKPRNRIFELFNERTFSTEKNIHAKPSKEKLNGKNKKNKKIKYKIKVSGILNRNKKDLNNQKEEELPQKTDIQIDNNCPPKFTNISEKISMAKISKNKPLPGNKAVKPVTREVKNSEIEIKNINCKVNNTTSPLQVKKCKSSSDIKKSVVDTAIERLRKNRGIEVKKVTKMETKVKSIPSLMPVRSLLSKSEDSLDFDNKTQLGQVSSVIIDSYNVSNKSEGTCNVKGGSIDLSEIVDDEIEDYLEIDQNIVADLEALIPEEEIESISNTLISSTKIPNTVFSHCHKSEIEPVDYLTKNQPLNEANRDFMKYDEIVLANTDKSREVIEFDIKKDIEMKKVSISDGLDKNGIEENNIPENVFQSMMNNEKSEEETKVSKRKSGDILLISKKQKVLENLEEEPKESKHNKRRNLMQTFSQKSDMKLDKHSKVKSKIKISKNIRKITDFLFPIEKTDENFTENSHNKTTPNHETTEKGVAKSMAGVTAEKASHYISSGSSKETLVEMRTLRSCSKQCQSRDDITKIKKIELPKLNSVEKAVKGPKLIPEIEVTFICKNDVALQSEKKCASESKVESIHQNNAVQRNEKIVIKKNEQIAPLSTECSISTLSTEKHTSAADRSDKSLLDKSVISESEILIRLSPDKNKRIQNSEDIHNHSELKAIEIRNSKRKVAKDSMSEKKQSVEIIEKKSEGVGTGGNIKMFIRKKQIDSKVKIIDIAELPKIAEKQFDSNEENHAKLPKLNMHKSILTEAVVEEAKPFYSELENSYKESGNEIIKKYSASDEEVPNDNKIIKIEPSKVILCSETAAGVERQMETIIKSNNLIEQKTDVKIIEKQCESTEHNIKLNDTISKTRLRSKAQKDLISKNKEAKVDNLTEAVVQETKEIAPPTLEIRKSKRNISDSNYPKVQSHQRNRVPDENIPKIEENCKVFSFPQFSKVLSVTEHQEHQNKDLESVDLNELGKTNSPNQITNRVQKKTQPCEGQEVAIPGKTSKIRSSQKTGIDVLKTKSMTRFQLRKKIAEEISNENIEMDKPIHVGKETNTELIDDETLNKSKFQNNELVESHIVNGPFEENNLMLSDLDENAVKTNIFRNTRRNKIENEKSSTIPQTKANRKRHTTKIEANTNVIKKGNIKKLVEKKVRENIELPNSKKNSLRKRNRFQLKAKKFKILNTKNRIKPKTSSKRLSDLKSRSRKKIIEDNNSTIASSKSRKVENKTNISNKKKNQVVKSLTPNIQTTCEVETNTEMLGKNTPIQDDFCAHNLSNEQLSDVNEIKISDSKKEYSENELIAKHHKDEGKGNMDEKYTFRSRRTNIIRRKTINSKIHNVVDTLTTPKDISKSEDSPNTLLENVSKTKLKYKDRLNKNKTEINSTHAIVKSSSEVDVLEQLTENIAQDCLNESGTMKKINVEDETNVTMNVQNIPSSIQENINTEKESCIVEAANSKSTTNRALQKSLTYKVQGDDGSQLEQKNNLEKFSADSSSDILPKTKYQLKIEIIESSNDYETLNSGKLPKKQLGEVIENDIPQKLNDEIQISNQVEECRLSENVAVDVAYANVKSTSKQKYLSTKTDTSTIERGTLKNARRRKEHDKSSISQVKKVAAETIIGHSQETLNIDQAEICESEFQQSPEETRKCSSDKTLCDNQIEKHIEQVDSQNSVKKTTRRHEAPVSKVLQYIGTQLEEKNVPKMEPPSNTYVEIKSRKKPAPKAVEIDPTNADGILSTDKCKLKIQNKINDEKSNTADVQIDIISSQVVVFPDQETLSVVTEDIEVESDNSKIKKRNIEQVKPPVFKAQEDLELLHRNNDSEKTEIWLSKQKLDVSNATNIKEEQLQMINEMEATTSEKISDETKLVRENRKYDSLYLVPNTRNMKKSEDIGQVKVITNETTINEEISSGKPLTELFNDLDQSEEVSATHSPNVEETDEVDLVEPKKRRNRKAEPKDQTMKIRQITRKRKNKPIKESISSKIEIGVTKLQEGDKAGAEDNYNIPYRLKEDLANPNSELSQEIERQMQMEFSREFPNYGSRAPEPYRRIYRCRICLLVCQTYGRLKLHRRVHDVPTPYQCQQCDKSYDDVEDLAAHLRIHRGGSNIEEGENNTDIEENNEDEYMEQEDIDVKPLGIERSTLRNRKTDIIETNMQSTTCIKKEKLIGRKKKAEVIDIGKVGTGKTGIFQKITRSRVKQFLVKDEPETENFEGQKQEDIGRETFITNLYKDIEDEEEDSYICEDDPNYGIDSEELPIEQKYRKVRKLTVNNDNVIDNVDSEPVNKMVEADYSIEQETKNQISDSASDTTKCTKKGKRKIEYRCRICLLVCQTYGRLKQHKKVHDVPMPYQCRQCDMSYDDVDDLAVHLRIHRGRI